MTHTVYTSVTPLPPQITRQTVLDFLHTHKLMMDLNPLIESTTPITRGPARATPEEFAYGTWYEIVDRISYLPRGMYTGKVKYHVCFHDLPEGIQTRCYAPMGLDIKEKWSVGGAEEGEMKRNQEMGVGLPQQGLYIREDVDMRCSALMSGFVKKNLKNAHGTLVDRLIAKAGREEVDRHNERLMTGSQWGDGTGSGRSGVSGNWGQQVINAGSSGSPSSEYGVGSSSGVDTRHASYNSSTNTSEIQRSGTTSISHSHSHSNNHDRPINSQAQPQPQPQPLRQLSIINGRPLETANTPKYPYGDTPRDSIAELPEQYEQQRLEYNQLKQDSMQLVHQLQKQVEKGRREWSGQGRDDGKVGEMQPVELDGERKIAELPG